MPKRKILINSFSLRDGGGQTHISKLIEHLNYDRNYSVIILLSKKSSLKIRRDDVEKLVINWPVENQLLRTVWEILFLPLLMKKLKIDLLFCPGGVISNFMPKNIKSATMFRNMTPFDEEQIAKIPFGLKKMRNLILKKVMLRSMQKADLVIFISQFAEQIIKRNLTKSLDETILIPHGVDFSELSELEDINHIITEPYILYPSSLDNYKSQLEVVEAYSILSKKRELPNLVLVGSHNQNRNYLNLVKDKILNTGLEEKVILTGKIDYELMPSIYRKSEMVVFASQTENCPNILLEAMSSNKFILCSNIQPMPEFAKDTVIYFNPKAPEDLANKLDWALDNPQLLEHFASMAFEESKNYSWKTTSIKTWDSLNSII